MAFAWCWQNLPSRFHQLEDALGWSIEDLCVIFNGTRQFIFTEGHDLLITLDVP